MSDVRVRLWDGAITPPRLWSCPSEVEEARAYTCGLLERYTSKDIRTGRTRHLRRAAIRPDVHERVQLLVARTFARVDAEAPQSPHRRKNRPALSAGTAGAHPTRRKGGA